MSIRETGRLLSELGQFLKYNKRWWLAPIIVMVVLLSALIALSSTSALYPHSRRPRS